MLYVLTVNTTINPAGSVTNRVENKSKKMSQKAAYALLASTVASYTNWTEVTNEGYTFVAERQHPNLSGYTQRVLIGLRA